MRNWTGKRYWLVGASEGLGLALARNLSRAGAEVILSARNEARLETAVASLAGRGQAVVCDVRDGESVRDAAAAVGQVDGLIYLAGVYWPMRGRDWNAQKAAEMADINFTGATRVLGHVLPQMVARGQGHLVFTGSIVGPGAQPAAAAYSASKAAVAALARGLHSELHDSGVAVQLVRPGFMRTRMSSRNPFQMPMMMETDEAAQAMFEHLNTNSFQRSFPLPMAAMMRMSRFLPAWARVVPRA